MKKLLEILLAAIIILSFTGCGNEVSEQREESSKPEAEKVKIDELLTSEKWSEVYYGEYDFDFQPDGSVGVGMWEIIENDNIKVTYSSGYERELAITEENGFYLLRESYSDRLYAKESEVEEIRNKKEYPDHISKAFVTDNNGETKVISGWKLSDLHYNNSIKFEELYKGAYAEVIGTITKIHGSSIYTDYNHSVNACMEVDGWEVEIADKEILMDYDIGDKVKFTGYIYTAAADKATLFIFDGKPTTIEHYNG